MSQSGIAISSTVYHEHIKDKLNSTQSELVIKYLIECQHPITANMLYGVMNRVTFKIHIVSLRRTLHYLESAQEKKDGTKYWNNPWHRQACSIDKVDKCPITKVKVGWYKLTPDFKKYYTNLPQAQQTTLFPKAA